MSANKFQSRSLSVLLAAAAALNAGAASAIDFQFGENTLQVDNLLTIGASWRMQDPDPSLIGKSTLQRIRTPNQGLCVTRNNGTYSASAIPLACSQSNLQANEDFVDAPGSYSPNGDNGNLNFKKGDVVHAIAKLTSDISFGIADYNFFVRPIYYFDANYSHFDETHYDQSFQPAETPLPAEQRRLVGSDLDVLDYYVSTSFDVLDRSISVKVGNQVLNWGESSLLIFNSLNTINPVDATKLRMPGLDLKELLQPVGMVVVGTDLMESMSLEGWYQYDWKPLRVDPVGTFFSQSDTLGPGGDYAMLGFAKNPDDPDAIYSPLDNSCTDCEPARALSSEASRTVYRDHAEERRREPSGTGQFGAKLGFFLEDFNNGTELAFYAANYHSRFPIVSAFSANATCANANQPTAVDVVGGNCNINPLAPSAAAGEILPLDTMRLVVEYPENIKLYGMSFNTTVGDYALAGEYAYRPNLPVQIHTVDLTYAALNAATPADNIPIEPAPGVAVAVVPGCRYLFPDFVSRYRGVYTRGDPGDRTTQCGYGPNEYIRGYERLEVGNANLSVLRLIGGDNPIGASQMTMLFEMGMNQVFNMPGLDELQFQGGGTDLHISHGADGTAGIQPADSPADNLDPESSGLNCPSTSNPTPSATINMRCVRSNPSTNPDHDGFGSSESYGYRFLNLNRWDSALFGANLETLTIIQHDVKGTTPGIGTNFVQGRKQYAFGLRFDYLSTWIGEVRYSWNTGGAKRDGLRDRDNIAVSLGVQF